MSDLGKKVKLFRGQRKISQYDLSRATGIEQATISRIERGQMDMLSPHATRIADALGVPVATLLGLDANVTVAEIGGRRIPVLDYVQAGQWTGIDSSPIDEEMRETVLTALDYPASTFALRIRGDSMEPEFKVGDVVLIDPTGSPRPGDFVVAVDLSGEATFKQYRDVGINDQGRDVFELVPLNSLYAPMRSDRQEITIKGVMVEHRKYRKR